MRPALEHRLRRPAAMIHVFVADDHEVVREGLKRIVDACEDMEVVGDAEDGWELLAQIRTSTADVLLLDISMPGPGFLEVLSRLRHEHAALRPLVLSMHGEERFAVRALRAGAVGYLTKNRSKRELAEAIRRVYGGGLYVSRELADELVRALQAPEDKLPHECLSDREYEIFRRLGSGQRVNDIARLLGLSPKTVSTYRARVLRKTGLGSNAAIIRYAIEHQLVD